jgi:ATP-dependent DNA helicase RecG
MQELETISGVGEKTVLLLNKLGIYTKNDLVNYYPFRYEVLRRSVISDISDGNKVVIDGIVEGQPTMIYLPKGLKKIIFRINTQKTILNVTLYNQVYIYNELKSGKGVTIIGKYNRLKNTIVASEVRFELLPKEPKIEPIYYTTNGLSRKNLSKYIYNLLESDFEIENYIPDEYMAKYAFKDKKWALTQLHFPKDIIDYKKAKQQLKYEELFRYLYRIAEMKNNLNKNKGIKRNIDEKLIYDFMNKLSFELTIDQLSAVEDIIKDLNSEKQMNRLLQGDVGCGKTIVAFLSIYANYLSGYQSALMAPTAILASQHYKDALNLFENTGMKIVLLTSNISNKEKKEINEKIKKGEVDLIIGTHSLIQSGVEYNNLGLVITDEQHRFGVNQRDDFKNKGHSPDVLLLSATPIPRTYALTIYGDVDISNIKTKPKGRKEVITYFKKDDEITSVLEMMKSELDLSHQIYVIAPSIMEDSRDAETVEDLTNKMNAAFGKIAKIGMVHGKLETSEKEEVMSKFKQGEIDILISTTVIEVGVNVPNASMMIIFNANLFGLATLHQLRGRVGRSDIQSYCILLAKEEQERLKMLETCNDGFEISKYDFLNRGEGDLFGTRQSGDIGLMLANINRDYQLLLKVKEDVNEYINKGEFLENNILFTEEKTTIE